MRAVCFTCAYTPLPLIHAAGLTPYRLLPTACDHVPDQAGAILHDNLCPHVKRVLDRGLAGELPGEPAGVVLVGSCDAMRRLADAWRAHRPDDPLVLLDLPSTADGAAAGLLADELEELARTLGRWSGTPIEPARLRESIALYAELSRRTVALGRVSRRGALQRWLNRAVTSPPEAVLEELRGASLPAPAGGVPLHLFGNVLSDPEALELLEECGARIVDDDLCTGSRQLTALEGDPGAEPLPWLARRLLERPPCARTLEPAGPGLAPRIVERARAAGARGVIAHVLKFCDPYLARLPVVRAALREAGLPLLVLEGDCTLRSLGQQRTRIEAFVEMLS